MKGTLVQKRVMPLAATVTLVLAVLTTTSCAPESAAPDKLKVGLFAEYTGAVAGQAAPGVDGCLDYLKYVNDEENGVNGIPIEATWSDVGYSLPKAISAYQRFKEEGIVLGFTWSSPANEGLRPTWEKDSMPIISNAVSVPALYPPGPIFVDRVDYTSMFGGFVDWVVDEHWPGTHPEASAPPKLATHPEASAPPKLAIVTWDNPFGRGPLAGIPYAESRGVGVVTTEFIPFMPTDTSIELRRCADAGADYIFSNVVAAPFSVLLKDAYRLGLSTAGGGDITLGVGFQAGIEELLPLAQEPAEGALVTRAVAGWYETELPGVKHAHDVNEKYREGESATATYLWGWALARIATEALTIATDEVGSAAIGSADVLQAVQQIEGLDMGGVIPPVTYSASERRASMAVRMVQIAGGEPELVSDWLTCPDLLQEAAEDM
ncbi:MAG: ABC transporter substrate-binding protein [Chloroflexota bacterium]